MRRPSRSSYWGLTLALLLVSVLAFMACSSGDDDDDAADDDDDNDNDDVPNAFALTSTAFGDDGDIPVKHVCTNQDGENLSPAFSWSNAPEETAAFAITCRDLDGPEGIVVHWGLVNFPADTTSLDEGVTNANKPAGSWHTASYCGNPRYDGPCPPSRHRYEFTLHALSETMPDPGNTPELAEIEDEISANTLATAKILGYFPAAD
ncbi:MAG: YbhB/YbcL family Raf kinase inhibitor-like protein [Candidatus Lernaella stagnicola]|nr:YbhB/YbcL family Raf kinase inhibitor-like protein [Candidatus Lernaella stagnicola]